MPVELVPGVVVSDAALAQIVLQAADSVTGARVRRPRRGLEIAVGDDGAAVELELAAAYGTVLPELAREVQERVAGALATMCGFERATVDVAIEALE